MHYKKISKLILLFLITGKLFAQLPNIQFENITTANGLADDDNTFEIYQDTKGFMWFSTRGGLSRYDGYSFKNYRYNPFDSTSIRGNIVTAIYEDKFGQLWIGANGLNKFDPVSEEFIYYQHNPDDSTSLANNEITDILQDGDKGLWIATANGLDFFDFKNKNFTHYMHNPNDTTSISSNIVSIIYIDKKNTLWVGTGSTDITVNDRGGLNRFDPATKTFKHYFHSNDNECSLADNNISKIIEDKEGNLYVGTAKATLHRYNRKKDCFERLNSQNKNYPYAPLGKGFTFFKAVVLGFVQDRDSNYWVSTISGGLNYFDLRHNQMKHYPDYSDDSYQLGSKNVLDIYEDRQGIIWLSVFKNGVYKVIPSHKRFHPLANNFELYNLLKDSDVRVLLEDSHGTFWIGTSTDIFRFYPSTGMIKNYSDTFDFSIRFIDAFYEDSKAGMWFSGAGVGLNRIDLKTGIVKRYLPDDKIESFPSWSAQTISAENDSILWLGCEDDGLIHFNINSKTFIQYKNNPSNERSLSDNTVWYTMIDQKKDLWLGTNNGLNHFNRLTGDFDRFLSGVEIHVILEDRKNNLWLGTINNGLIRFNIKTGKSVSFDKEDGLLGNDIFALLEDDQGYIWIGSAAGLNRLDPSSMTFTSFKKEDGVQSRLTIWADATLKTKNGKLLFGGNEGITAFAPDQFKVNTFPPYVSITGLSIFDKPYKEKGILDSIITLDYNQNDLTIEYVGLHFKNPSSNKYMVKLEPYEKGWSKPSNLRKARYTNLAPGKYIFYVKASNSDGVWNEEGKKLSIIINPPIWATWWAYSFYVFIIFGFLYSTQEIELNRQRKNSEIKESKLRAEAAELQAKASEAQAKVIQAENDRKTKGT